MSIIEKVNFKNLSWLLIFVYVLYAVIYIYAGEKVPINNGFGWDGAIYGNGVKDFPSKLLNKDFQSLHVERLLPSAVLYGVFSLFNIGFNDANIIMGFAFLNVLMITCSMLLWRRVAAITGLTTTMEFLGLLALTLSFPVIKFIPYYPVLTDAPALFIGFLTLYGFLTNNKIYMIAAFLMACFTWAIAALAIPLLMIFRKDKHFEMSETQQLNKWMMVAGILVLDVFIYYFFVISNNMNDGYPAFLRMAPADHIPLSLIIGTIGMNIYLVASFGFFVKFNIWKNIKVLFGSVRLVYAFIFITAIICLKMYVASFPTSEYIKFSWYIIDLFTTQALQPFSSIVSMILFFGPIIYLAIFKWKFIISRSLELGAGFMVFFTANLIQCLDAETRHLIFFFPFIIFLVALSYNNDRPSLQFFTVFIAIALLYSKVWYRINTEDFLYSILNEEVFTNEVQQRYFMHHGLFMSYKYFLIQTPIVAVIGMLFYRLFRKSSFFIPASSPAPESKS